MAHIDISRKGNHVLASQPALAPSWPTLRQDLENLGADIAKLGEHSLQGGQDKLTDEITRLKTRVGELVGRMSARGYTSLDEAMAMVTRRPLTSLAGAFTLGVMVAALSGRPSR